MTAALDLSGPWAKLERANAHVETLRAKIGLAGHPDPKVIPLRRKYEPEYRAVVYRIERVIQVGDDWGLIVGDAIHNMRSALDHLAWALAVRHFGGVEPTSKNIIKDIQFPVLSKADEWPTHRFLKHMDPADVDKLERYQPFKYTSAGRFMMKLQRPGAIECPLEALSELSNSDKHRVIQVLYVLPEAAHFTPPPIGAFTDCRPVLNAHGTLDLRVNPPTKSPRIGDEVLRLSVVPEGPNPDVDLRAHISGYVAVREHWDVFDALDTLSAVVSDILSGFGPRP